MCPQPHGSPTCPPLHLGELRGQGESSAPGTLWDIDVGPKRHPAALAGGVSARLDIEVKYGAPLNYSVGERGSQDGVLLFCRVINSL